MTKSEIEVKTGRGLSVQPDLTEQRRGLNFSVFQKI